MVNLKAGSWATTVIPETEHERAKSTGLLFQHAGWAAKTLTPSEAEAVNRELGFWYDAGYCPDALLIALDQRPDKVRQKPRRKNESLPDYLRSRLKAWYSDDPDASLTDVREPPRRGVTPQHFYNQRKAYAQAQGLYERRRPLSRRGNTARQEVKAVAAAHRTSPLERMRRATERRVEALASLELADGTPEPDIPLPPAEQLATPRLVALYAGRQFLPAREPHVIRILQRLRDERRPPNPAEKAVLRNAVRAAQHRAGVGALEAVAAEVNSVEAGILSADGVRMLSFLDHAYISDLPLDIQLKFLNLAVGYADEPQPPGPRRPFPLSEPRPHPSKLDVPRAMDGVDPPKT